MRRIWKFSRLPSILSSVARDCALHASFSFRIFLGGIFFLKRSIQHGHVKDYCDAAVVLFEREWMRFVSLPVCTLGGFPLLLPFRTCPELHAVPQAVQPVQLTDR